MKIVLGLMVLIFISATIYSLAVILLLTISEFAENEGYELRAIKKLIAVFFKKKGDKGTQSTAYDVDKVLEQLEELANEHKYKVTGNPDTYSEYNEAWESCADRAIDIVKRWKK